MIGMINMLKPVGLTSSDVVVRVRGILRRHTGEKYKVGHMGTLDPGASGVLPVAIGNATRLFGLLANKTKIYRAIMRFGYSTDTCDSYGIVTEKSEHIPTISELASILPSFVGKINQIPPKYSAISINGKRAYSMARENIDFDIPVRTITINSLEIIEQLDDRTFVIDINCMGGTYIRTLIYDIAKKLESNANMISLIRLSNGNMNINDSITLEELEVKPTIILLAEVLHDFSRYDVRECDRIKVINGVKIKDVELPEDEFVVYNDNEILGIGHSEDKILFMDVRL